jgi:hypothetical protein
VVVIETNSKAGRKIFKIAFTLVVICGGVLAGGLPVQEAYAAFPYVPAGASGTKTSLEDADTYSVNIDLPTSIASGDLIIAFFGKDHDNTATWPDPWEEIVDASNGTVSSMHVAYLIATGGETSVTVTTSDTERSHHIAIRIPAASWHGTTPPEVSSTIATGNSQYPNSASLTPSWGSEDTLWISTAAFADFDEVTLTSYPSSYSDNQNFYGPTGSSCGIGIASRELNTTSQDPGQFTMSAGRPWIAATIAVRPAAAAPDLTWSTGSADYEIYSSASLTWDAGTLVCSGTLTDNNASTIDCDSGAIADSTQYRVQVILKNSGAVNATMAAGDWVDNENVKGGWAGTTPTLGNCGFNDVGTDNGSTTCTAAYSGNDVRITNTGGGDVVIASTTGTEGFMYLITTDSDVPATDATSYMNASIDGNTEDSSKIDISGPAAPDLTWSTGSADYEIYSSSSLTWDAGTPSRS